MTIFRALSFTIPRERVLMRLHYSITATQMTQRVSDSIDAMIAEGYAVAEADASIAHFAIAERHGITLKLSGTEVALKSAALRDHLADCDKLSLFVCTVGLGFQGNIQKLLEEGEITKATVLDAVASETVEAVADTCTTIIAQEARGEKALTTTRFSPGYGDWPLSEQEHVLHVLNAAEINVRLNENYFMIPEKSITACIGWKKDRRAPARGMR